MKILLTGNKGYIGSILSDLLSNNLNHDVVGFDINYYVPVESHHSNPNVRQIHKDIRDVSIEDLAGIDVVFHLAALSNDPLGEFNKELTYKINYESTIKLAKLAKESGVSRFIYSSSQSMYGISSSDSEIDEDKSTKNPLTEYAKTKWLAECDLKKLCDDDFTVVCFRPSTVFGYSPYLRCDIVYNNLVASAYTTGKIEIKSDGTPWRPVVHVRDVCKAFIAGLQAPKDLVSNRSYNVGISEGNYTVRNLAEAAQSVVPGCELVFTGEHGSDSRTYKVSFDRILNELKEYYKPTWNLQRGGEELVSNFKRINFTEEMFRGRLCNRLDQLTYSIKKSYFDTSLRKLNL